MTVSEALRDELLAQVEQLVGAARLYLAATLDMVC